MWLLIESSVKLYLSIFFFLYFNISYPQLHGQYCSCSHLCKCTKARSHGSFWDDIISHCELFEIVALMILKMRLMFWFYESHLSFRPLQCPTSKRLLCLHLNPFFQDLIQLHVQGLLAQSRKGEDIFFVLPQIIKVWEGSGCGTVKTSRLWLF